MAGIGNKLKKLTDGLLGKKEAKNKTGSFSADSSTYPGLPGMDIQAGPYSGGLGTVPDLSGSPDANSAMALPLMQSQAESRLAQENLEKIRELENRFSKLDVNLTMAQKENEGIKKTVDKIDQSVIELLSLYEIVSNQVNPFVGDSEDGLANIERFEKTEKRINELGEILVMLRNDLEGISQRLDIPGIAPEVEDKIQAMGAKMDSFASSIVVVQEGIEELSQKTDSLYSKYNNLDQNIIDLAESGSLISERVDLLEDMGRSATFNPTEKGSSEAADQYGENVSKDGGEAPVVYLRSIKKDPMSAVVLLNWIEFLMERVGRNNLMDALDYYMDINWISEDVRLQIIAYARGIDYYVEKATWRLLPEDHTKSLMFIEKLCGRKIDKNMLSTVDREMSKVKHGLEELYGI